MNYIKKLRKRNEMRTEVEKKLYWRIKDQIKKIKEEKNNLKGRESGRKVTYTNINGWYQH